MPTADSVTPDDTPGPAADGDAGSPATGVPHHLAVIMDGNGRWAKARGLPRTEGHRNGEERLADVVRAADALGIGWFTAFGFSTENWTRPKFEVDYILALHKNIFGRRQEMHANNVRIRCIGRPVSHTSRIPRRILREMDRSVDLTQHNTGLQFTLAFDYGGREELAHAARRLLEAHRDRGTPIEEATLAAHLYEPALPQVDLLVRTSGEHRVSNFLLWEAVEAPFYVTSAYWPDFDRQELQAAIDWWRRWRHAETAGDAGEPSRVSSL